MSPRAVCRLATLGFTRVHDYAPGKVDWLAHGLLAEGTNAGLPTAGTLARQDAATCTLDTSSAEALEAIAASRYGFALVLSPGGLLLGRLRRSALEAVPADTPIEPILEPGPSTIRPHLTVEDLRQRAQRSDVQTLLVTRPDGTLVGVLRREEIP
jgi:CBS domain-containing protein